MMHNGYGHGMMGNGWGWMGGWMSVLLIIILILFISVILFAIIKLNQGNGGINTKNRSNHALDLLNERYVKGEISDEEYANKKKMILK